MVKINIGKRGQITIFIIIAILIVAILLIVFYPNLKKIVVGVPLTEMVPRDCIEEAVKESLKNVTSHGGRLNPQLYFMYNGEKLDYICYTSEWYQTCVMQNPFLKQSIQEETLADSDDKIKKCYDAMIEKFESKGYNVQSSGSKKISLSIEPKKIVVGYNISLVLSRDETQTALTNKNLEIEIDSNIYDIAMIASSIQNFEARYGDSNIDTYMGYYPNLKVEKYKQSDGTKVYILTDRDTQEKLQFATRSLAWPPGYMV